MRSKEQLIKRSVKSSQRAEQSVPQRELQDKHQSYNDYLIQTGKRHVTIIFGQTPSQTDKDYLTQTYKEYLAKEEPMLTEPVVNYLIELKLLGNTPPPIIVDGKEMSGLELWDYVLEKRKREKQEAIDRGEFPDINRPAPLVAQKLSFNETAPGEERRDRNVPIARALYGQLVGEMIHSDLDLIAVDIQKNLWKDTNKRGSISQIKNTANGNITIKNDGTVINRIRVGLALSYPSDKNRAPAMQHGLTLGIGYFGDRTNILPEAQRSVTDEELKKGIKAYFIERTFFDVATQKQKTYMTIIPFAYANSQRTFYEHLADSAIYLDPRRFIPLPRRLRYRTPMQAAA